MRTDEIDRQALRGFSGVEDFEAKKFNLHLKNSRHE